VTCDHFTTRAYSHRHGARLIGRWASGDGDHVFAVWAYENHESYEEIQQHADRDPDALAAQVHRGEMLDPLITETEEEFVFSTVPLALTELAHLDERSES
jgi:hypothetical protein